MSTTEELKKKSACIGPCYPPNTKVLHPITLQLMTSSKDSNKPFCPIQPWRDKIGRTFIMEECTKPTDVNYDEELEKNFIIPKISFDPMRFLITYYNIRNLDNAVMWYNDNPTVPYSTIQRIMNCALKVYGEDELYNKPASDLMIDFARFMILEYWLDDYLLQLSPYIVLVENIPTKANPSIDKPYTMTINDSVIDELKESHIQYFDKKQKAFLKQVIQDITTTLLIRRILKKMYEHYKDRWTQMDHHLNKLNNMSFLFIKRKLLKK